jgi:alpha-L-fucosidase 2
VAALAEALLQSHAGAIDLLPALPADLDAGEVTGLVARPGVLVDIRWRDRALVNATLRARLPCCRNRLYSLRRTCG